MLHSFVGTVVPLLVPMEGAFDWAMRMAGDFETTVKVVGSAIIVAFFLYHALKGGFVLSRLIIAALTAALCVWLLWNVTTWGRTKVGDQMNAAMIAPASVPYAPGASTGFELPSDSASSGQVSNL